MEEPTPTQQITAATAVVRDGERIHRARASTLWTNIAVAAIAVTVMAVALTYAIVVHNLTAQIDYLTASDTASRLEQGCRSEAQANLDEARASLDVLQVEYDVAYKDWVTAVISHDQVQVHVAVDALNESEDRLVEQSKLVDAAAIIRKKSPQACVAQPEPQPSSSTEVG